MVQVTMKVDYLGRTYQTNVLAKPGANEEEIYQKALDQVKKQWSL
ncbi:BA3454 family stress response protein [Peribacillus saganii]|uniref:BA3454 family stress response protein n=1 Tax=Peribacillus saganii TaxID=2303992 RepID=A0A372LNC5_9BACI|nr:BA3454 family stress response protein [Peribacillus saganii]RFU69016.1 BA3454 family stress response protein [Peribacillus saganii]